jgi:aldehyde dehydrogenase (NAD+)
MSINTVLDELNLTGDVLEGLGGSRKPVRADGDTMTSIDPATGEVLATIRTATAEQTKATIARAHETFTTWRQVPAPVRGEMVRDLGDALRAKKKALGALVSIEMGKIRPEGEGEVQEMIDICDFAVGLSRQLYGLTMASERPKHRLEERWHPLGVVGIISAFNFPVAVWSWNAALAAVCGDTMVWKPSSETPLCGLAVQKICDEIMERHDAWGVFNVVVGPGRAVGETLIQDERVPLVSFTGSTKMGRHVAQAVAGRLGQTILELGGNNAVTVLDDADLEQAARAITFGAVGTAGQRCTSTRRVLAQKGIVEPLVSRLMEIYDKVPIGNPIEDTTLMGPLVNQGAVDDMMAALEKIKEQGGEILRGGKQIDGPGFFVEPTIVRAKHGMEIVQEETFAPILYVIEVDDVEDAIRINNDVPQGLSSALFTTSMRSAGTYLSESGSDCGLSNVNTGTSGAEIGGAFGGEKETGGGRESGSDAWKGYMRRQTGSINFGTELPLAQGIKFGD